jgi:hypothetical protein
MPNCYKEITNKIVLSYLMLIFILIIILSFIDLPRIIFLGIAAIAVIVLSLTTLVIHNHLLDKIDERMVDELISQTYADGFPNKGKFIKENKRKIISILKKI